MNEELPDWSLLEFLALGGTYIESLVGSQKDGDGKFVMGALGVVICMCIAPIWLLIFILMNRFRVSVKTWVYFIVMIIVIIGAAIN
jgi:uncharacterized integral membrane protein